MIRFRPLPKNIREKLDNLADLFLRDPNIIFAYLFGSLSKGQPKPLSDIDLAVYLKAKKAGDYLLLFGKISKALETDEIDLVILNDSPPSLAGRILGTTRVLIDKAPTLRHKYESTTLRNFFDFQVKEKNILQGRYGIG